MRQCEIEELAKDIAVCEMYLRMAIKAETINGKDKWLFFIAKTLGFDVEDLK